MQEESSQHSTTHPQVRVLRDGEAVYVDAGLVKLLQGLWRLGFDTVSSCQDMLGSGSAVVGFRTAADAERFVAEFGGTLLELLPEDHAGASDGSVEAGYTVPGMGGVSWPLQETGEITRKVLSAREGEER